AVAGLLALLVPAAWMALADVPADPRPGVTGVVVDAGGNPVAAATVRVLSNCRIVATGRTDAQGKYHIRNTWDDSERFLSLLATTEDGRIAWRYHLVNDEAGAARFPWNDPR